jgi:hypothetical protein
VGTIAKCRRKAENGLSGLENFVKSVRLLSDPLAEDAGRDGLAFGAKERKRSAADAVSNGGVVTIQEVCSTERSPCLEDRWVKATHLKTGVSNERDDADARTLFERLLSCCNDAGLLAEEFDPMS